MNKHTTTAKTSGTKTRAAKTGKAKTRSGLAQQIAGIRKVGEMMIAGSTETAKTDAELTTLLASLTHAQRSAVIKGLVGGLAAEGWRFYPPPRAMTPEQQAADAKKDADRKAATLAIRAAVKKHDAARSPVNVAVSEIEETFRTQMEQLLRAIGLLGAAQHPDGLDEGAVEEALTVLVCARETLLVCVGGELVSAGVFTGDAAEVTS